MFDFQKSNFDIFRKMSIGKYRLILTKYSDSVINEIDLFTETELHADDCNEAKSTRLNQNREAMIKQVKDAENLNLKHLDANKDEFSTDKDVDISKLFSEFCFILKQKSEIRLIVTDEFVPEKELNLFHNLYMYSLTEHAPLSAADQFFEVNLYHGVNKIVFLFNFCEPNSNFIN